VVVGRHAYRIRVQPSRQLYQVFTMKPDGSEVSLVANTEGHATAPAVSRDGAKTYFPVGRNVDLGHDCPIFVAQAAARRPMAPREML
jgi:Tol biopolymer transport system component